MSNNSETKALYGVYKSLCGGKKPSFGSPSLEKYVGPLCKELAGKKPEAVFASPKEPAAFKGYEKIGRVTGEGFTVAFFKDGSFLALNEKESKNTLRFCDLEGGLYCFDLINGGWRECAPRNAGYYALGAGAGEGMLFKVVK